MLPELVLVLHDADFLHLNVEFDGLEGDVDEVEHLCHARALQQHLLHRDALQELLHRPDINING